MEYFKTTQNSEGIHVYSVNKANYFYLQKKVKLTDSWKFDGS